MEHIGLVLCINYLYTLLYETKRKNANKSVDYKLSKNVGMSVR